MIIEGVDLSPAVVAALALRLHRAGHRDLAQALGLAIDGNRPTFQLRGTDRAHLLDAAKASPGETLNDLRAALARP